MDTKLKLKKASKALRYSGHRALARALDSNREGKFVPFIVLTRSRSGSNLLKNFLNSSPEVECFGEIFRHADRLGWDRPGVLPKDYGLSRYLKDPVEFLKANFLNWQPCYVKAAGFKLFYYHSREEGREHLWDFLRARKDIRIIHLRRENLVRVIVSRELAMKTGVWIDHGGGKADVTRIRISPEAFEKEIETTLNWELNCREFLSEHQYKEIVFEEMMANKRDTLDDISEFLDLKKTLAPVTGTQKQGKQAVSQILENFEELKAHFRETQWEKYWV